MIKIFTPKRSPDPHGSGAWQAPRGSRIHNGIDYACLPESTVLSSTVGMVTKLGYVYSDDLSYRYVEVCTPLDYRVRYFYVEPSVKLGQHISLGDPLGIVQDISKRYVGITPHVHLEIKQDGKYINPELYFGEK